MLKPEVADAVRQGKFHVWALDSVDDGIELLTGVSAGQQQPGGKYAEGTVHYLADKRLRSLADAAKEFAVPAALPVASDDSEPASKI